MTNLLNKTQGNVIRTTSHNIHVQNSEFLTGLHFTAQSIEDVFIW